MGTRHADQLRLLPLSLLLLLQLLGCVAPRTAAATATAATQVVRKAQHLRGDLPMEEALRAVELQPQPARAAARLLADHGFRLLLDLQLLGGGREGVDLMEQLATSGMNIAERAKIRLLVGDRAHVDRLLMATSISTSIDCPGPSDFAWELKSEQDGLSLSARKLQDSAETETTGISMDTVAIVLSVLVGAAGCVTPG